MRNGLNGLLSDKNVGCAMSDVGTLNLEREAFESLNHFLFSINH